MQKVMQKTVHGLVHKLHRSCFALLLGLASMAAAAQEAEQPLGQEPGQESGLNPVVVMETSMGAIVIELWQELAPVTVANFLRYVDDDFFDGLTFHRVIPGFMIQGGGLDAELAQKPPREPIVNEAQSEVPNDRGTIAMARTGVVDSATSQFFINLVDNDFLNHVDDTPQGFGYAVFGEVIEGMEVVDAIAAVETAPGQMGHQNVPVTPVTILATERR